jgi:ABC-2 type transport system permease protein
MSGDTTPLRPEPLRPEPLRPGRHAAGAETGVIHDIGYRHYTGPRLGRGTILRALYLDGLRGAYGFGRSARSKVTPLLLVAAMTVPAVIMSAVTSLTGADKLPMEYTAYAVNLQLVVLIYVAAVAPATVSRDLRYRTVTLYFSRPLSRFDYVAARFAAMASAVLLLIALPLTVLLAGALLAKLPVGHQVTGYLQGLAGAVLFAVLLTAIGLLVASVTPRRGFGVAAVVAVLLVAIAVGGTLSSLAQDQGHEVASGYLAMANPFHLVDGVQSWLFGSTPVGLTGPPGTTGDLVYAGVTLLLVLAGFGLLLLRYRKVSVS